MNKFLLSLLVSFFLVLPSNSWAVTTGAINATTLTTTSTTTIESFTGLLKAASGVVAQAVSGTDYAPATSGSSILSGNGSGGFSNVTVGRGLSFSGGSLTSTVTSQFVPNNIQVFTSSGTWTQPAGITSVYVKVIGAGGSGGAGRSLPTPASGGGGGGGGYAEGIIAVTGNVTVTIGSTNSFAGTTTIQATAGTNGTNAVSGTPGSGGDGGVGSNGTINLTGASGGNATSDTNSCGGAGGGSAIGPGGQSGGVNNGNGGGSYGGGGAGGGSTGTTAGVGDAGAVIVYY